MIVELVLPGTVVSRDIPDSRIDAAGLQSWTRKRIAAWMLWCDHAAAALSEGMCPAHMQHLGARIAVQGARDEAQSFHVCPSDGQMWNLEPDGAIEWHARLGVAFEPEPFGHQLCIAMTYFDPAVSTGRGGMGRRPGITDGSHDT